MGPTQKYKTIQSALDAAKNGDTILVAPGIYQESLTVNKVVRLLSTSGAAATAIDCSTAGYGGALDCVDCAPSIHDCEVFQVACTGIQSSGAASLSVNNCTFSYGGWGILTYSAKPLTVSNCRFSNCRLALKVGGSRSSPGGCRSTVSW